MCSTLKVVGPQNTRFNILLKIVGYSFLMKIIDNSPPLMPHPTDTESQTEFFVPGHDSLTQKMH